jgi:GNAT superfamily N-acetyltransferase
MTEIRLYDAADLDKKDWRELQAISRDGFAATFDRSQDEIDALVEWNDPSAYHASHVDPNSEVGNRYNANQEYTKPRVAVALDAGAAVGFAYSAHNVSGATALERMVKRSSVVKNYLWIREVVVAPAYQRQGIAGELGRTLLKDAIPLQPPTTYVWPGEMESLQESWEKLGFKATGEQRSVIFGKGSEPVKEVRMQAASVKAVLQRLTN